MVWWLIPSAAGAAIAYFVRKDRKMEELKKEAQRLVARGKYADRKLVDDCIGKLLALKSEDPEIKSLADQLCQNRSGLWEP